MARAPCPPAESTAARVVLVELHVGTYGTFAAAGFTQVARPSKRRAVMRIDFG